CDLPRNRACIIGIQQHQQPFERLILHPQDYGMSGTEVPLPEPEPFAAAMQGVLEGDDSALAIATVWNSGFYLWRSGSCESLKDGIDLAYDLLSTGKVAQALTALQAAIAAASGST
ncbi:MAG: hypothetical protein WBA10_20590, partial [Elainellaceae cyanobacterium]